MNTAVMPTYGRADVAFERGEGCYLTATDGRRFLDFSSGIAVVCLGHSHPHIVQTIQDQAAKLMHTSNLYHIPNQTRMAERLAEHTFADTVFTCNSGAEANECMIKLARKYQSHNGRPERYRIVTFEEAFHGRTLATIAAAGQEKLLAGFGPPMDGFDTVPFGDVAALRAAIGPQTAGILVEPIQGEGGYRLAPEGFLKEIRALCDAHDLVFMIDEVQTGMARTGKLLGHQWDGVDPDVAALGKGLGGGFPIGACIATEKAAAGMTAGTHGSTYGGNPLATAVANAVLDVMLEPGFLDQVNAMGDLLRARLEDVMRRNDSVIEEVRGRGLMLGLKTRVPNLDVVNAMREHGVLTVPAGDNVVRFLPPLIVGEAEIEQAIAALEEVCRDLTP